VDAFLSAWFQWEHRIEERLVQHIASLRAAGLRCYLATNQEQYRLKYLLEDMGFEAMFDGVFCSCRLGAGKPEVEYFRRVWQTMDGIAPHEALFWDDRQDNIDAARSFGLHAELYTDFDDFTTRMAPYSWPK
jgi:putative hydrolase of the HAD superfamily